MSRKVLKEDDDEDLVSLIDDDEDEGSFAVKESEDCESDEGVEGVNIKALKQQRTTMKMKMPRLRATKHSTCLDFCLQLFLPELKPHLGPPLHL